MSDCLQNILGEAAHGPTKTAEHLGRVALMSSANYDASRLPATSTVATVSGNAIKNSSANSAPPWRGTPLYGLYRYVRPQRALFFSRFGHKLGIDFSHFAAILVINRVSIFAL